MKPILQSICLLSCLGAALRIPSPARGASATWSGASGADLFWSTPGNCSPAGAPGAADAARLAAAGYDLALVGSALMTSSDPSALLRDMLRAGREAR